MNTNYADAEGKHLRFRFSGNVYRVSAVDRDAQTITFHEFGDPEDPTTETFDDLLAADAEVLG